MRDGLRFHEDRDLIGSAEVSSEGFPSRLAMEIFMRQTGNISSEFGDNAEIENRV